VTTTARTLRGARRVKRRGRPGKAVRGARSSRAQGPEVTPARWHLRLYVAGSTPKSLAALANLTRLCEAHLAGQYDLEVVDLLEHPNLARTDQILAIPTLVRTLPEPIRKVIGDLSSLDRVLVGLGITPRTLG